MPGTFTAVDLSRLPAPAVIEALDFDTIYAACLAEAQALLPDFDATVESDPAVKLLQIWTYREQLLRARINDASRAVMVAFATGADLDQLGALFGVNRLVLSPANPAALPPIAATFESDEDLRRRIVLAPEGYSVAGPVGAYIFHALSADPTVQDASVASPSPGVVNVTILTRAGDGVAGAPLLASVFDYLDDRRPLTDELHVLAATLVDFAVSATIKTFAGPDPAVVITAADASLSAYLIASRRLGRDITRAGVIAALMVEGVQNVVLTSPAADVVVAPAQVGRCTSIVVTPGGAAE